MSNTYKKIDHGHVSVEYTSLNDTFLITAFDGGESEVEFHMDENDWESLCAIIGAMNEFLVPGPHTDEIAHFTGKEVSAILDEYFPADGPGTQRERTRIALHHAFSRLLLSKNKPEKVPNLSTLEDADKKEFVDGFVELTAKNVLSVFVALGLKTHIDVKVVNDANGDEFQLLFTKLNPPTDE